MDYPSRTYSRISTSTQVYLIIFRQLLNWLCLHYYAALKVYSSSAQNKTLSSSCDYFVVPISMLFWYSLERLRVSKWWQNFGKWWQVSFMDKTIPECTVMWIKKTDQYYINFIQYWKVLIKKSTNFSCLCLCH